MGLLACLAALLLGLIPAADAAQSPPVQTPRTTATLVTDSDSVAPGHRLEIALRLRLAPGWHTYWQNPGDAGAAPTLDLSLPKGVMAGPIAWPTPARQQEGPLTTYGYTGDVLLPEPLTPTQPAGLQLAAHATWLACKDICVPEEANFQLNLPPGPATPSAEAGLFTAAAARAPRPAPFQSRLLKGPADHASLVVTGAALTPHDIHQAWFLPAGADLVNSAPQPLSQQPGRLTLGLTLTKDAHPDPLSGILVLQDPAGHDTAYNLTAAPESAPPDALPPALLGTIGLAFLGGLILNLMPCVFPILAMKAISLTRLSGHARSHVRRQALSYAAGILVTFAALAGVTIGLRAAGIAAGWGFQFQSPIFVTLIAWLLFGVGLSLFGAVDLQGRWTGAGASLTQTGGHLGSFFTGLLAVLVATPCTAPFMGAAVAGALVAPPATTLLIFLTLGAGLASPTLLLVAVPQTTNLLPRPGRWTELLKQALAFPMFGAAIWLVWVLSLEAGPTGVLAALSGMLLLGLAAWIVRAAGTASRFGRHLGLGVAAAAMLAAAAILAGLSLQPAADTTLASLESAEPFTSGRLADLRAEGRPVFVNMTAAWCVTCLINERVALSPPAVRAAFAARHVTYLLGDWTREDPAVTRFLQEQGRDGVPLYMFYPAGGGAPVVLPQILTEATLLKALTPGS